MECISPLSDLHKQYSAGKLSKKNFEGMLFQHLLENFEHFRIFNRNRDRWNDFLSWLYPRLVRAIDLYRDVGSSFDAYINKLIYGAAREFRCREIDHNITEYVCWRARAEEMTLCESEPEYTEGLETRNVIPIPEDLNRRQILMLLLKSYFFVTDEFAGKVAFAIGMDIGMVQSMIDELKKRRSEKETDILNLRERIHCQHYRCLAYQKRMTSAQPGSEFHEKLKSRFERAKKRYSSMKKRLNTMRMSASNRMIAEVLGVPRGTVDSNLFAIKNRIDDLRKV